jgi:chromosomal replication initiation ATPase DnaA
MIGFITLARPKVWQIVERTAKLTGTPVRAIVGECRAREYTRPRFAAALVAHRSGYSSPMIGRCLGRRHHSTILSAIKRARKWEAEDASFAALVKEIGK